VLQRPPAGRAAAAAAVKLFVLVLAGLQVLQVVLPVGVGISIGGSVRVEDEVRSGLRFKVGAAAVTTLRLPEQSLSVHQQHTDRP